MDGFLFFASRATLQFVSLSLLGRFAYLCCTSFAHKDGISTRAETYFDSQAPSTFMRS